MKDGIEAIYPLSPTQQGMLFHTIADPESGVYVGQMSCRLGGDVHVTALEEAWGRLLDRHSALRTSFVWRRVEEPRQVVHERVPVRLDRLDWTNLPAAEHGARLQAYLRSDRRRGFDLAKAPLMRVTLIRLQAEAYHFIWTLHHLLIDGWCQHLLLRELFAFYEARRRGRDVLLPPARPYRDYIAWLRRQSLTEAEAYWRRALKGFTAPTVFSVDRHAGEAAPRRTGVRDQLRALPASATAALRDLARQNHLTLNTLVQGAWALLLSRYSSGHDVVFGVVVSGRPAALEGVESMVGLFINTLPLRVRVQSDAEVLPWLQALQLQHAEMNQYEHSPLVQVQSWSDVPRGLPLFESIFLFQNYPALDSVEARIGGLEVSEVSAVDQTSYPLAVFATAAGPVLSLRLSYDPGRFGDDAVHRMLGHLVTLLEGIVARPTARLGRLSILTDEERERVLVRCNDTHAAFHDDQCVHQLFEAQVAMTPDAVAAVFGSDTMTYADLNRRANRLAHHLRSLGVGPDARVGVCVERSLEMVAAILGILKAGGAYVPLDASYPVERLRFMMEDAQVPVLLTQERLLGRVSLSRAHVVCLDAAGEVLAGQPDEDPVVGVLPENLAYVIYTSGSMGWPKGVAMSHRALSNLLSWQLRSSTPARTLQFASPSFDVCFQEVFSTLCSGGTLLLIPEETRRDPRALMRHLREEGVGRLYIPFTGLQQLSEAADGEDRAPSRLVEIITAGEQLQVTRSIARWLGELNGCVLHNHYGPTESHVVTALALTGSPTEWPLLPPIGRPIANTQIYVLDADLGPTPVGVPGELHIGGMGLARGYQRRPDLTAERFIPNPFSAGPGERLYRTGDLARWLPDGNLEFLGRLDHQVKVRGFRIELGEIEAVLALHPAVREAVVTLREEVSGNKRLVAYVVVDAASSPTTSELRQFLQAKLPDHMVPAVFVMLEALPLLPNGKVDRRALPAPEGARPELEAKFVAPRNPVEEQLARIWSKTLGVDRVGMNDNFFELGGDSILSIQIVAKANQAGLRLTPRQVFQHQTIADLSLVAGRGPAVQAEQGMVTGPVPLTPIQRWFFEQDYPEPHHCNMSVLLAMPRGLDEGRLALALEQILLHHDALRLRYTRRDDGWAQESADGREIVCRVDVVDLSGRPDTDRTGVLEATAARSQGSLRLTEGPLLRATLFRMGGASDRLLLVVHHLVVDGVSWRILVEDLMTAYRQLSEGDAIQLPPKTTSFRHWSERLSAYARSTALEEETAHWLDVVSAQASPLPRDHAGGANDAASADTLEVSLGAEETRALLQDVPAVYRTQINDVLLTALAQAFARWTGKPSVRLDLEGHGREELFEDVDLSRTVGWFTALFPVHLTLDGAADPGQALKSIKEQLRAIPRRGIGYGLLRYAREDEVLTRRLRAGSRAEVSFNYLGQFDHVASDAAGVGLAEEPSGPPLGLTNTRAYLLEINGGVGGGRLRMLWRYSRRVHERATIERLAGAFIDALRALIAHCQSPDTGGYTPSDFPLAALDQPTLDRLVGHDRGIEDIYPLAPMQSGLLFHSLYARESGVYFEQVSCTVEGGLDVESFRRAWQRAVDRHHILRTSFAWEGLEEPLQIVHRQASIPWQEADWRGLPAGEREHRLDSFLKADLARGFDLTKPPLMRLALIRLAEDAWQLVWSRHHLLLDGWSGPLLLAEWLLCYEAYARGQEASLERPRPYRDFIAWLRREDLSRAEVFWRAMLEGIAAPTPIAVIRPDGGEVDGAEEYARHDVPFSADATVKLERFARRHQLSMNTLVQAAWALLLSRYSGEEDVVFGVTVSGRPADFKGIESMLGVFINTLPLRVRVEGRQDVLPWLRKLQERLAELRQYESSPLVQIQGWSDVPRGLPLFESMVAFENYPVERSLQDYRGSLRFSAGRFHVRTNYPVTLAVVPGPELSLHLLYDGRRIDDASCARMLRHFATLLEGMVEAPERRLSELPILSADEERRLLVAGRGAPAAESPAACLHDMFQAQAERTPGAVAVVAPDARLTYQELNARANQVAHHLTALGAGPGDQVAVYVERGSRCIVAMLGVLKAGGTYVLLDAEDSDARLRARLDEGRPLILLTETGLRERVGEIAGAVVALDGDADAIAARATLDPPARSDPGQVAYVDYAGGRGVLVEHQAAHARLALLQRGFPLSEADAVLSTASPATEAFALDALWALLHGARVVLAVGAIGDDPASVVRAIVDHGVTVVHVTPGLFSRILALGVEEAHSLRGVISSGESFGHLTPRSLVGRRSCRIVNLYGAPEAGWAVTGAPDGEASPAGAPVTLRRIGLPIGMSVHVLDRDLRPVPEGVWGEICLGGRTLARGYLDDAQETRYRFVASAATEPLFRTGDTGRVLSDGTLEIADAGGTQVWIGGFRVEPDQVAATLLRDPSVEECVVLARETEHGAAWLVAYLVGRVGFAADQLRSRLEEILPASLVPRIAFVPVSSIPLTAAGRLDEAAFCRLDVTDADLIARWEERLRSVPEIDQAVVLAEEEVPSSSPLHLGDVLPQGLVRPIRRAPTSTDEPSHTSPSPASEARGSGLPAICHGAPLRQEADAPRSLYDVLRRAALQDPARELVYLRADGSEIVQSYPELRQTAERILAGLRGLGLLPQDKVLFQLSDKQDFLAAFWGCQLGGFVPAPLSVPPTYRQPSHALGKLHNAWTLLSRPVVLVGEESAQDLARSFRDAGLPDCRVVTLADLRRHTADERWYVGRPEETALLLLTSGSTGLPKAVALNHRNMLSMTTGVAEMNGFSRQDVSLNWFPLDHVGGIVMFHVRDVYLGCRQIQGSTESVLQDPLKWLDWIDRHGVTITWAPNFAFGLINERAAEIGRRRWNLASLRFILNGGEAVVAKTARTFLALLAPHGLPPTAMHPAWGMSETSSGVTYSHRFSLDSTADDQRFVEVGDPIPGVSVRIVDDRDELVVTGTVGRLQVKGPPVTCGYYQSEELTREAFTGDGWFKTGDLGFLQDGQLTITGREKDIIIVNGVNYYCHEIESVAEEVPGVEASYTAACAVRRPGDDTDRLAIFFSAPGEEGALPLTVMDNVREHVLRNVGVKPEYLIPVDTGAIPKTTIGKIQRSVLRDRFASGEFDAVLKRVDILTGNASTLPDWFYGRIWRRHESPVRSPGRGRRQALVLLDGLGLGDHLCDELDRDRSGPPATRVEAGVEFARLGPRRYRIDPGEPEHYHRLRAFLAEDGTPIDDVLHLWTYDEYGGEIASAAALDKAQERGAYSLLFLLQALAHAPRAGDEHPVSVLVISSHAQSVSASDPVAPEKSPMLGLIRTMSHEIPGIRCRHLDLAVDEVERNAVLIQRELRVIRGDQETAYRDGRRLVPRLQKVSFRERGEGEAQPFRTGGMYLITGGLGGIGTEIARYLLQRHDARVLLLGRTVLPERDTWVTHLARGGAIAQRIEAYLALERHGGRISYEPVDVCDEASLRRVVERWTSRWKCGLAGVMHLAGVLQERLLLEETRDSVAATLRPKMVGSWVLQQVVKDHPHCVFVHFASVNGMFGGATMGAYAAANCFLHSWSHHQNVKATGSSYCFSWTVWEGVGMSREYVAREQGRARGYQPVSVEQGLNSLLVGLSHRQPSLLVGLDGGHKDIRRMVVTDSGRALRLAAYCTARAGGAPLESLRDVIVHDRFRTRSQCEVVPIAKMPLTEVGEIAREQLVRFRRGARRVAADHVLPRTEIERRIARIWQDVLRLSQVGIHDNFFELGGDSILAIQAISRANQAGLRFTPAQLFQHQTVARLAMVSGTAAEVHPEQGPVTGPVSLTPIQHWFFEQDFPAKHHFNMAVMLRVTPDFDPSLMEAAVGRMLVHHDALRLRFEAHASGWRQWNAGPEETGARPVFVRITLADVPETEQGRAIEAAAAELETSLDLVQGPIMRVAHVDLGPGRAGRLLVIVHHLVIDGVSWRILLEDLLRAYQQLGRGIAVILPPKTTSFQSWAARLSEHATSAAVAGELDGWLGVADVPALTLPMDHPGGVNAMGLAESISVSLTRDETQALLQVVPEVYHTQINDVLLTALGETVARWTGHRSMVIDLEGHGREEILDRVDVSRTLGWFTTLFPVRLDLPPTWAVGKALQGVKEQLRRVPNHGIGFGMLRYLAADQRVKTLPTPEISFNYLGQVDATGSEDAPFALDMVPEAVGRLASPEARRPHLLDVVGLVTGGSLRVDWAYGSAIHEPATIERLARGFVEVLREIIAHCQSPEAGGYTPSDFPMAKLDEEQLDTLLAQVEFEGDGPV